MLSALGSGPTATHASMAPRLFGRLLMGTVVADKAIADDLIRVSGLNWTLGRPAVLTNGPHSAGRISLSTSTGSRTVTPPGPMRAGWGRHRRAG
ncbi:NAD(P)H-binding protein [Streptomyces sp. NPDC051677]|uniref:NAD(P)H-binding protein n=1 Tax=Streptomyces sp. NPDC051677 TaxID=3365669 RepID=UPI0037D1AC25